jgi:hypothetical protein
MEILGFNEDAYDSEEKSNNDYKKNVHQKPKLKLEQRR